MLLVRAADRPACSASSRPWTRPASGVTCGSSVAVGPEIGELGTADPARDTRDAPTARGRRRRRVRPAGGRAPPRRASSSVRRRSASGRPEGRGGDQGADGTAGRRQVRQRDEQALPGTVTVATTPPPSPWVQGRRRSRAGRRGARRRPDRSASSPAATPARRSPEPVVRPPRAGRPSCRPRDRRCGGGSRRRAPGPGDADPRVGRGEVRAVLDELGHQVGEVRDGRAADRRRFDLVGADPRRGPRSRPARSAARRPRPTAGAGCDREARR